MNSLRRQLIFRVRYSTMPHMKYLTVDDINNLYEEFQTPPHVMAHCKGVTDCALKLADALAAAGVCTLDRQLIYGAGMTHDMARKCDAHEIVAANRLEELGYHRESAIVREHMRTMTYHDIAHLTEADLLYISDRMVLEDTFVGIEKRFAYLWEKMRKNHRDPDSEQARRNYRNAVEFVESLEIATGKSIFEICGN